MKAVRTEMSRMSVCMYVMILVTALGCDVFEGVILFQARNVCKEGLIIIVER
jgi:hypothetical protein